jgi:hypothetical protein
VKQSSKKFSWRVFSSFGLTYSFILIVLTGVVLYIAPAGRVSRWIRWELTWLDRTEWIAVHTVFSYVFIGFACFHLLVFNWKAFLSYLKRKASGANHKTRELFWASTITIVVFLGTVLHLPPFGTVMDAGNYLSGLWGRSDFKAPFPHTEKMTIQELTERIPFLYEGEAFDRLSRADIQVSERNQSLDEIGEANSMSPLEVLKLMLGDEISFHLQTAGQMDTGALRLKDIAVLIRRGDMEILDALKKFGMIYTLDDQLNDIAKAHGTTPGRILRMIKEELSD